MLKLRGFGLDGPMLSVLGAVSESQKICMSFILRLRESSPAFRLPRMMLVNWQWLGVADTYRPSMGCGS